MLSSTTEHSSLATFHTILCLILVAEKLAPIVRDGNAKPKCRGRVATALAGVDPGDGLGPVRVLGPTRTRQARGNQRDAIKRCRSAWANPRSTWSRFADLAAAYQGTYTGNLVMDIQIFSKPVLQCLWTTQYYVGLLLRGDLLLLGTTYAEMNKYYLHISIYKQENPNTTLK